MWAGLQDNLAKRIGQSIPWLIMLVGFLVVTACSGKIDLDKPPDIAYGVDPCDRCLMIINEARFAAAYITSSGETRRFDDIGGMLAYIDEFEDDIAVYWVHDFETEVWLKAEDAYYVDSEQQTPMGFGIVAFNDWQTAENWSDEYGGTVLTFEAILD